VLDKLENALEKYRQYRHPTLDELQPSQVYALFPKDGETLAALCWPAEWPESRRAGVYLIFSETCELLYIGKAWLLRQKAGYLFRA
jgi:hypothetical protein